MNASLMKMAINAIHKRGQNSSQSEFSIYPIRGNFLTHSKREYFGFKMMGEVKGRKKKKLKKCSLLLTQFVVNYGRVFNH